MGFEAYISEEEAARIAGVSVSTLNSFVEAGYLSVEQDLEDGLRLFSKEQVAKLFGVSIEESKGGFNSEDLSVQSARKNVSVSDSGVVTSYEEESFVTKAVANENVNSAAIFSSGDNVKKHDLKSTSKNGSFAKEEVKISGEGRESARVVYLSYGERVQVQEDKLSELTREENFKMTTDSSEELVRIRHLCKLLESTLAIREEQLKEMREERDWLRKRLSLLEERIGRDQILLLSEAQMIKGMIEERRSTREVSLIGRLFRWFFGSKGEDVPKALPAGKANKG
ncbi:MAG: hypothetical protein D6780_07695 [Candidatus Dadabacteria bacterium]|nr:MAG: hypothetical protein D6780_07695 [Candidatus Dadabacteria bacterium]